MKPLIMSKKIFVLYTRLTNHHHMLALEKGKINVRRACGSPKRNHLLTWNEPVVMLLSGCECVFFLFDYYYWKVLYLLTDTSFISFLGTTQGIFVVLKKECKSSLLSIGVCFSAGWPEAQRCIERVLRELYDINHP